MGKGSGAGTVLENVTVCRWSPVLLENVTVYRWRPCAVRECQCAVGDLCC